jgi:hypothetical protein
LSLSLYFLNQHKILRFLIPISSVAEPELEPVEQQLFAGAGAKVFFDPAPGIKILIKCYKTPKFFILKFEVYFKNHNLVAIYF